MENNISGSVVTLSPGDRLTFRGEDVNELYIVLKGRLKAMTTYGTYYLGPGSAAGLADCYYGMYIYNYFAEEETTVRKYSVNSSSDIAKVIADQAGNAGILVVMQLRNIADVIKSYLELNIKCRNADSEYRPDARIYKWELDKFNAMSLVSGKIVVDYHMTNIQIAIGAMYDGARFLSSLNDACSQMADKLEINLDYVEPEEPEEDEFILALDDSPASIFSADEDFDAEYAWSQLEKSLPRLLSYSEIDSEEAQRFTQLVEKYRDHNQQTSLSDDARQLRRDISKLFYKIYYLIFNKAVNAISIPPIVSMFLNFGYMDENLLSKENAIDLYELSLAVDEKCNGNGVYTIFTWLREILWGDVEPSKNSMDMDYAETITSQRRQGKLTPTEAEKAMENTVAKVQFEIENMFTSSCRVVCGKGSTFCPILTDNGITRPFSSLVATVDKVKSAMDSITSKDYSAFYREIIYQNKDCEIDREFIMAEVKPNVILMPTPGIEGLMWQEIEGRKKDSPARFIIPLFPTINIANIMIRVTGRFRWEMCKRSQGVYWNNISEPSLTAEYCDYIQFYKKNRELPEAAKDKIKSTLTSCRNNYREVFVKDYEIWMIYEAAGSFRLTKVSRKILATYCPFVKAIRDRLKENPMVKELFSTDSKAFSSKVKHLEIVIAALERKGFEVPKELADFREFLKM